MSVLVSLLLLVVLTYSWLFECSLKFSLIRAIAAFSLVAIALILWFKNVAYFLKILE